MDVGTEHELRELEESLWRPETRHDGTWMRQVLHPDFFEFGRSGRVYDLAATLEAERSPFETVLPLPDFAVVEPAPAVALVTYVSRVRHGDGEELAANRSSLWVRDDGTWRLRFHQGTPV